LNIKKEKRFDYIQKYNGIISSFEIINLAGNLIKNKDWVDTNLDLSHPVAHSTFKKIDNFKIIEFNILDVIDSILIGREISIGFLGQDKIKMNYEGEGKTLKEYMFYMIGKIETRRELNAFRSFCAYSLRSFSLEISFKEREELGKIFGERFMRSMRGNFSNYYSLKDLNANNNAVKNFLNITNNYFKDGFLSNIHDYFEFKLQPSFDPREIKLNHLIVRSNFVKAKNGKTFICQKVDQTKCVKIPPMIGKLQLDKKIEKADLLYEKKMKKNRRFI